MYRHKEGLLYSGALVDSACILLHYQDLHFRNVQYHCTLACGAHG